MGRATNIDGLTSHLVTVPRRSRGRTAELIASALSTASTARWNTIFTPSSPGLGRLLLQLPLSWQQLGQELNDPTANSASLERLERIASRLMLCRQAEQAISNGEANWLAILGRS